MEEEIEPRVKAPWTKIVGVLAGICSVYFVVANFTPAGENARRSSCQSNLKQIMLGIKQYVRDYDESYPILKTSGQSFGWADAVQPYIKSTQIFQCPSEWNAPNLNPTQPGYSDYWFNAKMAGKKDETFGDEAEIVALGDGNSSNARYHL